MARVRITYDIPGFLLLLTLLFIAMKFMGYIEWSWWWVFAPVLIPYGILLVVFAIVACFVSRD